MTISTAIDDMNGTPPPGVRDRPHPYCPRFTRPTAILVMTRIPRAIASK
jgi:hypothetical protein